MVPTQAHVYRTIPACVADASCIGSDSLTLFPALPPMRTTRHNNNTPCLSPANGVVHSPDAARLLILGPRRRERGAGWRPAQRQAKPQEWQQQRCRVQDHSGTQACVPVVPPCTAPGGIFTTRALGAPGGKERH